MSPPTTRASNVWPVNGGDDVLQIQIEGGNVLGGINALGAGFGALLGGISSVLTAFSANSAFQTNIVPLSGSPTPVIESNPINIPAGNHTVVILAQSVDAFANQGLHATGDDLLIYRGAGVGGLNIGASVFNFAANTIPTAPMTCLAVDTLVGPISGQIYTAASLVTSTDSSPGSSLIQAIVVFVF